MGAFGQGQQRRGLGCNPRIIIAIVIAAVSLISYYSMQSKNPVTGQNQRVAMTTEQEIAMGLQAAPEMASQYGGLSRDSEATARVERVGKRLLATQTAAAATYPFEFHLLADPKTINAFALPGGQVFITEGLYRQLTSEGQLAGVLGHEIGHVIERHSAEHIAKAQLTQGLTGAAVIATYDPNNPSTRNTAAVAAMIGQLVNMKYGRDDEYESDLWGVRISAEASYDPRAMVGVMEVLKKASGGGGQPEFMSTHPDPGHRMERIEAAIQKAFPNGLPDGLEP